MARIYISYTRKDAELANQLYEALRARKQTVFYDVLIKPGEDWEVVLEKELTRADAVVFIVTPNIYDSKYVPLEAERAAQGQKIIIPVRYEPVALPPYLARYYAVDAFSMALDTLADAIVEAVDAGLQRAAQTEDMQSRVGKNAEPIEQQQVQSETEVSQFAEQAQVQSGIDPVEVELRRYDIVMRAISDRPTDKDALGYERYANALAEFILHEKTSRPLAIAIDAPWGMGKTSLMKMIEKALHERALLNAQIAAKQASTTAPSQVTVPTVWFNAWKYSGEEAIWAALASRIITESLDKCNTNAEKLRLRGRLFQKRYKVEGLRLWRIRLVMALQQSLLPLFVLLIAIALLFVLVAGLAASDSPLSLIAGVAAGVVAALAAVGVVADFLNTLNKQAATLNLDVYLQRGLSFSRRFFQNIAYEDRIGFIHEFESDFTCIVDAVTNDGQQPLVVFIDDLDRCNVDSVAAMVEAISVFLDSERCVFVIGMDTRTVAAALNVRYKEVAETLQGEIAGASIGHHFLEKIVQITFRLPSPITSMQDGRFLTSLLDQSAEGDPADAASQSATASGGRANTAAVVDSPDPDVAPASEPRAASTALDWESSDEMREAVLGILEFLDFNPRRVKRFVNVFRLQARISEGLLESGRMRHDLLAKWLVLAMLYPDFVSRLRRDAEFDDKFVDRFEEYRDATPHLQAGIREGISDGVILKYLENKTLFGLAKELKGTPKADIDFYLDQVITATSSAADVPPTAETLPTKS